MEYECELCGLVGQSPAVVYEDAQVLIIKRSEDQWLALSKEHIHWDERLGRLIENTRSAGEVLSVLMIQSYVRTNRSGENVKFDFTLPYGPEHYHVIANFTKDYQDG